MIGEIIFYQSDDGTIRLETRLENETLWLTQQQMAELFQTTVPNISMHVKNVFAAVRVSIGRDYEPMREIFRRVVQESS